MENNMKKLALVTICLLAACTKAEEPKTEASATAEAAATAAPTVSATAEAVPSASATVAPSSAASAAPAVEKK